MYLTFSILVFFWFGLDLPIAVVGATNFEEVLNNFLGILSGWSAIFVSVLLCEVSSLPYSPSVVFLAILHHKTNFFRILFSNLSTSFSDEVLLRPVTTYQFGIVLRSCPPESLLFSHLSAAQLSMLSEWIRLYVALSLSLSSVRKIQQASRSV